MNTLMEGSFERLLHGFLHTNRLPSFLLFHATKEPVAYEAAKLFFFDWLGVASGKNSHADLIVLEPEGKLGVHPISRIRALLDELALAPHSGKRAVLIRNMERMLPSSSNALLKALEEPPSRTCIIATTHRPYRLLATIRSRAYEVAVPLQKHLLQSPSSVLCQKAIDLFLTSLPLRTFSQLIALSESLEKLVGEVFGKKKTSSEAEDESARRMILEQEYILDCLEALVACARMREDMNLSIVFSAAKEASEALEKQVSTKNVFLLFLCGVISGTTKSEK